MKRNDKRSRTTKQSTIDLFTLIALAAIPFFGCGQFHEDPELLARAAINRQIAAQSARIAGAPDSRTKSALLAGLAKTFFTKGDYDAAFQKTIGALHDDPGNRIAQELLVRLLKDAGQRETADLYRRFCIDMFQQACLVPAARKYLWIPQSVATNPVELQRRLETKSGATKSGLAVEGDDGVRIVSQVDADLNVLAYHVFKKGVRTAGGLIEYVRPQNRLSAIKLLAEMIRHDINAGGVREFKSSEGYVRLFARDCLPAPIDLAGETVIVGGDLKKCTVSGLFKGSPLRVNAGEENILLVSSGDLDEAERLISRKEYREAVSLLDKIIGYSDGEIRAEALLRKGAVEHVYLHDRAEAGTAYRTAGTITVNPNIASEALIGLARVTDEKSKARGFYRDIVEHFPRTTASVEAHRCLKDSRACLK